MHPIAEWESLLRADLEVGERSRGRTSRGAAGVVALGGFVMAASEAAALTFGPDLGKPQLEVVSGYAVNPSENLILNGDFEDYSVGGTVGIPGTYIFLNDWELFSDSGLLTTETGLAYWQGYLYGHSGSYTKKITAVSANPEFNGLGQLTNNVEFTLDDRMGGYQTVATEIGHSYLLSFEALGPTLTGLDNFVDGVFALEITGYGPAFLKVSPDTTIDYQIVFEALDTGTTVKFIDMGYATDETIGWDIPLGDRTDVAFWDNVSLTPVPEPLGVAGIVASASLLFVLWKKHHGKRGGLAGAWQRWRHRGGVA